jgi:hypothetical protein
MLFKIPVNTSTLTLLSISLSLSILFFARISVNSNTQQQLSLGRRELSGKECITTGDGDIYGLGVRIGLYLQWAAAFILRLLGSWSRISEVRKGK